MMHARRRFLIGPTRRAAVAGLFLALGWPCGGLAAADPDASVTARTEQLMARGLLPVTRFGAVPDDDGDDTRALQRAIDEARKQGMVAYFPSGEYRVSDTLRVMQPVVNVNGKWRQHRRRANALVGATGGKPPVLRLTSDAAGFGDPRNPKPVVWVWAQPRNTDAAGSTDPEDEQPNISFNQVFQGIDIDLRGGGHRGAVGIRHAGSQGSSIEQVHVLADGAFAGLYNLPGQGGGAYDVTVDGGRFGIWADHRARYPVIAGVTLRRQTKAAIFWKGQSNLTIAGFSIERDRPGPAITLQPGRRAYNRTLTLVDGVIQGRGALAVDNTEGRNLYLHNVVVRGYGAALRSAGREAVKADHRAALVEEYAYTAEGTRSVIDGDVREAGDELVRLGNPAEAMSADALRARHLWKAGFPAADDPAAVSITDFGARPDDDIDDTAAIRQAIAQHRQVVVPPGTFVVSDTVRLGRNTRLTGVAKHLSVIRAAADWHPAAGTPVLASEDSADSPASLSFLLIERPAGTPGLTLLEWRAGSASVVRDVMGGQYGSNAGARVAEGSTFAIRGHGGGRWYGLSAEWNRMSPATAGPGYRQLVVSGTRQPLAFYGLNIERGLADPQAEFVDAQHVAVYSLKGESRGKHDGAASVLQVRNSRDISIFGYSGNAAPRNNAVLKIVDSDDYRLANLMPVRPGPDFDAVSASGPRGTTSVDGRYPVALLRHGRPAPLVW